MNDYKAHLKLKMTTDSTSKDYKMIRKISKRDIHHQTIM